MILMTIVMMIVTKAMIVVGTVMDVVVMVTTMTVKMKTLVIAVTGTGGEGDVIPSSRYWAHRWILMLLWRPEIRR